MINQFIESAKRTFQFESAALATSLSSLSEGAFDRACNLLLECKGKIIVSGIGKSGHIARKIASTLTSTGSPAIFLHPTEAAHGDIGLISKYDVLLILSKSGESDELVALITTEIPIIAITSNPSSRLGVAAMKSGGVVIETVINQEACPHDLAPTSSTTVQLVIGDAIAIALLETRKFTSEDFAQLHPAGALGRKLTMKVADLMAIGDQIPSVKIESSLTDIMAEISAKRLGATCVIDEKNQLLGIITDGDIRRYLQGHEHLEVAKVTANDLFSKNPKTTTQNMFAIDALHLMEDLPPKVMQLPVTTEARVVVGMIHLHDIVKAGIN
ncbi:MAG: KpsF/GutQ family sugar-phosphate isomerase [bacterium]